jgi:hypothetical protein
MAGSSRAKGLMSGIASVELQFAILPAGNLFYSPSTAFVRMFFWISFVPP